MRYLVLACDYDGTLARDGRVAEETIAALERVVASGRKLVLVTGRRLDDLLAVFPQAQTFDWVVAENGAIRYCPATKETKRHGDPPPEEFVRALRARGVDPLSVGEVIVATWHPNENAVLHVIRDLGLEMQLIFNKGAVMILPAGITKATGLAEVLGEMEISPHNVVGIGDAENDHAFLSLCECSVAVANALPMVKEKADFVTRGDHGAGVVELIGAMLDDDLGKIDLGPRSFYFEGPEKKLKLGAQNLFLFVQIAEGVDDATWMHHLRRRDYSRWFRDVIKDEILAGAAERVESSGDLSAGESRALIKNAIEERYTLPA